MNYYGIELTDPALIAQALTAEVQRAMDDAARSLGYDDIKTAITYRGDPNPKFAAEAEGFFQWRSAIWTTAYEMLADSQTNNTPLPTMEEALAAFPTLNIEYP